MRTRSGPPSIGSRDAAHEFGVATRGEAPRQVVTETEMPVQPGSLNRVLLTAEEVARALAVSTTLVRQLTLGGDIPCRRIGRLVRYTPADIESFVHGFDERGYH